MAAEILCSMNGTISGAAMDAIDDKLESADITSLKLSSKLENTSVLELEFNSSVDKFCQVERNTRTLKSKSGPSSMGTVSGVIGKEYIRPKPFKKDSPEPTKPVKLDSKELPASEILIEEVPPNMTAKDSTILADVKEFLFEMLGDGFQLDMTVIQEVLGHCGYDMQKSLDKLLDLSASILEKYDDNVDKTVEKEKCSDQEFLLQQENTVHPNSAKSNVARSMSRNLTESLKKDKDRFGLQKEVLESLFVLAERSKEAPKRTGIFSPVRRSRASGKVVVAPHEDTTKEHTIAAAAPKEDTRDEDEYDENNYEILCKALKEYWMTMKEYYKAAVDAFVKGDHARANKLLQQGHFFSQRAREAYEKSAEKLVEARYDEIVSLDWCAVEPKEAVRLLRVHLTSLSGIPTIKYFRVVVGTNDEDTTKEARKRRIVKQLEKESIKWTEEKNCHAILIRTDVIDPKSLSFAKKKK